MLEFEYAAVPIFCERSVASMLNAFLDRFYQTLSFRAGEPFPAEPFRALFRPDALLLEKTEDGCTAKTLEEHIQEFEQAVRDYPQLFAQGFQERQTALEWTEQDGVFQVHSHYEKRYTRNSASVLETGINHMTILREGEELRIACVIW